MTAAAGGDANGTGGVWMIHLGVMAFAFVLTRLGPQPYRRDEDGPPDDRQVPAK